MTNEQKQRYDLLPPGIKKMIIDGKRLTKVNMGLRFPAWSAYFIYYEQIKRDELVRAFNDRFGTNIK